MKIAIFAYSHGGCAAARRVRAVLAEAETVCYAAIWQNNLFPT